MKHLTLLLYLLIITPLFAGSHGTAVIKGRSGTGRTQLELHTTDISNGVKYLKLTIDGKSYEFDTSKDPKTYDYIIHDHKNKVFTVFVDNKQIDFKFWMIPSSQEIKEQTGVSERWQFFAYVEATDPREFNEKTTNYPMSPRIYLYCTMNYSL